MITAVAIDDEPPALKVISSFAERSRLIQLKGSFNKPGAAIAFLKNDPVQLIFLDINMPSISGIDLFPSLSPESMIIFTTAHSQYAVEGFNLNAIDYLLKPFTYERFLQSVQKAEHQLAYLHSKSKDESEIFIHSGYEVLKLKLNQILYIQAFDDYLKIFLENNPTPIVTRMTMKMIMEKLPEKDFIRVHRSFIVPWKKVSKAGNKMVNVAFTEIPIGKSFSDDFFRQLDLLMKNPE